MADDEYGTCPYNSDHRIVLFRMPAHILKCARNYQGPPLERCKYNATHLMAFDEKTLHEENCRDRIRFHQADLVRISDQFK